MDEPLSNLDAKLRLETRSEIRRIHRDLGRATIYVTHDQDEALSLADRIVVMKDGVVQQIGTPPQVYGEPANLHVARFMGYRNVVPVRVMGGDSEHVKVAAADFALAGRRMQPLGERAMLAVRPDDFVVLPGSAGAATTGDGALAATAAGNTIAARVDNVEYAGRESLVDLVTPSGIRLIVRTSVPLRTGDEVRVEVPPERALVYPEERA
jgi:putative spermidine/putrescine transport system ATP-binding protein